MNRKSVTPTVQGGSIPHDMVFQLQGVMAAWRHAVYYVQNIEGNRSTAVPELTQGRSGTILDFCGGDRAKNARGLQ